ncbi:MAG: DNA polymerase III subunit alpha [Gammaproteobacteria bacterium]|nr:DNA polymerase III subunit alpha [Gammaproteobacteria bacterium]
MKPSFVHLRVHSEYSMIDGVVRIKPFVKAVAENLMPAAAISDSCNLFALVKFYNAATSAGIKPIIASDIWVASEKDREEPTPLVLIARNETGYKNLIELLSRAYSEGQKLGRATLTRSWINERSEGIIALSAGKEGDVGRAILAGNIKEAKKLTRQWMSIFKDDFYLELHRTGRSGEEEYIYHAVELAIALDCAVVATNDVRFLRKDQFEAHEVRVCIHDSRTLDDPRRERRYVEEQYLKSTEEMVALFSDLPEAIENTVEIARRCNVDLDLGHYYLPEYPVPEGQTIENLLSELSKQGLNDRLAHIFDSASAEFAQQRKPYDERLEFELGVINSMGFSGYFLIVMEFIQWAKDKDIPVGPGRGSGPASLVAYSLKITDVDPLKYDLLFERLLNPERVSLPDFDIDFCMEGRDKVIQHVAELYGREAVSQIITFGTMAAKAVVRDVARVQGKPYWLADKLSKLIPFEPHMTLSRALDEEPMLRDFVDQDEDAEEIMEMAFKLEGLVRNVGKHAGGVVIAPTRLTDFSPTYCDETGGGLMTQFDMNDVVEVGLVKFDFLGLRTLTIINNAVKSINARRAATGDAPIDITALDLEDPCIYENLKQAKTTAVFQLESRGMKDLMKKVKPSRFGDIVALVALFRPGPMQLTDDFIKRKHGIEKVDYLHPSLKHVLEGTYGVMLYQEQVMQIAQVLAGYSPADADLLRRAMGKKKPEEMAQQREVFLAGTDARGVDRQQADHIFNLMEKFAGYGFNKPHSVCYALIAYQTAWLKHYYPADFMAAVLSADMQNTDKVVINVEECREMKLEVLPPDINRGEFRFVAKDIKSIEYGLGAIKGLGEGPVEMIVSSRKENGQFKDLFDFCDRVDSRKANKRAIEALIGCGALDELVQPASNHHDQIGYKRALLFANQEDAVQLADQKARNADSGHTDLFGEVSLMASGADECYNHFDSLRCMTLKDRLVKERDTLGLYLTGHPIDVYRPELKYLAKTKICDLHVSKDEQSIAGLIVATRTMKNRKGETIAFVTLDDGTSRVEVAIFADILEQHREKLQKDSIVVVKGTTASDDYTGGIRMRANEVYKLIDARQKNLVKLRLNMSSNSLKSDFAHELEQILAPYRGPKSTGCRFAVAYSSIDAKAEVILGDEWRVSPDDDLIESLKDHYGADQVHLDYS